MNGSFTGFFAAGNDFVQANLNQPYRFGNISAATVDSVLSMYGLNVSAPSINVAGYNISAATVQTVLNMYSLTDYVAGLAPPLMPALNYVNGYLTNTNIGANQYLFFFPGHFDPGALLAGENTKQPVTVGEVLTLSSIPKMNAFAGPVLVITGCKYSIFRS